MSSRWPSSQEHCKLESWTQKTLLKAPSRWLSRRRVLGQIQAQQQQQQQQQTAADSEAAESPQPTQEAEPLLDSQPAEEEGAVQATAATAQPAPAPIPARMPAALLSSSTGLHHLSHPQGSSPPPKLSGAAVFCPRPCASAILEALLLLLLLLQAQR